MGRPRKYESGAERVQAFRDRHEGKRLDIYLDEKASQRLNALAGAWGCTAAQVIERLLLEASRSRYRDILRPSAGPVM